MVSVLRGWWTRNGWGAAWLATGLALPAGSAAALVQVRGSVNNADIGLLILASVLLVAVSGRRVAVVVAAGSAALSYDYFHTVPYHSFTIANGNDQIATLALGLLALGVGLVASHAARAYEELVLILGVAVLSQAVPGPARLVVDHSGLDVCLAVLVLVTALSIPPTAFRSLGALGGRLAAALAAGSVILPALSWLVSRLVSVASLRRGVLVVGLAPAEVASVAVASLAGANAPVAAFLLVTSTLVTVGGAGIALRWLGGAADVNVLGLLGHLALIVGAPMAVGLVLRARLSVLARLEHVLTRLSVALVTVLVWLVASQVRLSSAYLGVAAALVLFLAASAIIGVVLGWKAPRPVATAVLLSTSMRDFAIAAGVAVAAFGASARRAAWPVWGPRHPVGHAHRRAQQARGAPGDPVLGAAATRSGATAVRRRLAGTHPSALAVGVVPWRLSRSRRERSAGTHE